jgi:hypothetical protein
MNALRTVGLGLILILTSMAMTISIAMWPLGVAVVLAGLALLLFWGWFTAWKERQSLRIRPRIDEPSPE